MLISKYLPTFSKLTRGLLTGVLVLNLLSCAVVPDQSSEHHSDPEIDDHTTKEPDKTASAPCRYKRSMGIARLMTNQGDNALFEFYPGDIEFYHTLPNQDSLKGAAIGAEFKAVKLQLLDGPVYCEQYTFEIGSALANPL